MRPKARPAAQIRTAAARAGSALDPALDGRLHEFRAAVAALAAVPRTPRTVAVVGSTPGAGRSTTAALLALAAAGYGDRNVVVVDTVTSAVGPRPPIAGMPHRADTAGRSVTALLGGDVLQGRVDTLVDAGPRGAEPVARRRLHTAYTPHAAVPVLSAAPRSAGSDGFSPQLLEQVLAKLRYRADLVVLDTPVGPRAPVLHAITAQVDHLVVVCAGTADVTQQLTGTLGWLAAAPGRARTPRLSVVVVAKGLASPRLPAGGPPTVVLRRDEGLRRRRLDRMTRRSTVTGLQLAAQVLH